MDDLKLWETPNPMVDEIYHRDNYEVIDYDNTNICYVFFSSNGLFFPDTIKEFQEKIVDKNRYEWKRMASSKEIVVKSGRHIFVRDIYKQWYAKGISYLINSVDKMVLLLKQLTEGYDVITVGSSAGGYMAALMAAELSAKACFDFSGQISLWEYVKTNPFVREGAELQNVNKYYDISENIGKSKCIYYYFYPGLNKRDVGQFERISGYSNVRGFSFAEKNHAATMFAGNMKYVLGKNYEDINQLYIHYRKKAINKVEFLFRTVSFIDAVKILLTEIKHFIQRKYNKTK